MLPWKCLSRTVYACAMWSGGRRLSDKTWRHVLAGDTEFRCNGRADLCNRTLSEVALVGTHNSFANPAENYINLPFIPVKFANQNHGIPEQLANGVRVINLDVWSPNGTTVLCHGS
eukprot:5677413-Pyramimonas_sp.AAC.1